ncbi:MAG: ABC transporter substrate-binding protein [Deltaproteobacteria bacterium]|nr:ABC transporter substrate-binding protein [Deltaproteobacteria bacterium]
MAPENGQPVTDMTDRTVTIKVPAKTVFILTPILWHYLSVTLSDEAIVKLPPYMLGEFRISVLGKIFPGLDDKSLAFTDFTGPSPVSVEELLWSDPDAALIWDYMSRGPELVNLKSLLKISADGGDKTKLFRLLGELTDRKDRVDYIWQRFNREYDEVLSDLGSCGVRRTVAVIGTDGFTLWGPPSQRYFTSNLENVCGENVAVKFASQNGTLNIENLLELDPEQLWLNPYVLPQTNLNVRDFYDDPRFRGLKAVKNRRIYHMPLAASRLEGPVEVPLSILWQRLVMFPDVTSKLDLREKIYQTYFEVYGYRMNDSEIDNWLRMEENSISDRYIQLFGKSDKNGPENQRP